MGNFLSRGDSKAFDWKVVSVSVRYPMVVKRATLSSPTKRLVLALDFTAIEKSHPLKR